MEPWCATKESGGWLVSAASQVSPTPPSELERKADGLVKWDSYSPACSQSPPSLTVKRTSSTTDVNQQQERSRRVSSCLVVDDPASLLRKQDHGGREEREVPRAEETTTTPGKRSRCGEDMRPATDGMEQVPTVLVVLEWDEDDCGCCARRTSTTTQEVTRSAQEALPEHPPTSSSCPATEDTEALLSSPYSRKSGRMRRVKWRVPAHKVGAAVAAHTGCRLATLDLQVYDPHTTAYVSVVVSADGWLVPAEPATNTHGKDTGD